MNAKELFIAAVKLPSPAREEFLDNACAQDMALRQRVLDLIDAQRELGSFLDKPAVESAQTGDFASAASPQSRTAPREELAGALIAGRYKLIQQIGEGGMGAVFMAEQSQPVKRLVAVKVVKAGMDSKSVLARFEAERQALALMDHPNIAKVLDAGATESGQPYFVMELVKGVPLSQFCDERQLPVTDRLRIFQQICHAVQHAHQKGIIHRDLKPSNLLVESHDGRPVPKIIDFGLAKAVNALSLTDRSLYTNFGAILGTPLYMAPEQAELSAVDIDTRADIYALGVILYELLTGTTPLEKQRLAKAAWDEIRRVIKEEEPQTPSARLSTAEARASIAARRQSEPHRLGKLVRGDLDWIAMKALAKERDRRYDTANALAADVERFLNHEPVSAGPPRVTYKLRKFVRRNRGAVAATVAVAAALLIGTGLALWQAWRAAANEQRALIAADAEARAKDEAQAREAEAKAVLNFLKDHVIAAARPTGLEGGLGHDITLRAALEAALPSIAKDFSQQPLIEANLRYTLGSSFYFLGLPQAAAEQLEAAQALYTRYRGPDDPKTLDVVNDLALTLDELGRYAEGRKLLEETLSRTKARFGPDHPTTLKQMANLATSYLNRGEFAQGCKLLEEVLPRQRPKLGSMADDVLYTMQNLASSYQGLGRFTQALALNEEVLAARKAKCGPAHPETLLSMNNLAYSYLLCSRFEEAAKLNEETVTLLQTKLGMEHPETLKSVLNLATTYRALGRFDEALKLSEDALVRCRTKLGPDHPRMPECMYALAGVYRAVGRQSEALKLLEEVVAIRKAKLGPDHRDTLTSMIDLANSYSDLGRHVDALQLREETLARQKNKLAPGHPDTLKSMTNLANSYYALGRTEDARRLQEETLALQKAKLGPEHRDALSTMLNLAISYYGLGRYDDAVTLMEETLTLQKAKLGVDHPDTLACMTNLASVYLMVGRAVEALDLQKQTVALKKAKLGPDHPDTLLSMGNLAEALVQLERGAEAIPVIDECLQRAPGKAVHPKLLPQVISARLRHFAREHDAAGCRHTAEMWEKLNRTDAESLYRAACLRAVTAAVQGAGHSAQATKLARGDADLAMARLTQAVAAGYKRVEQWQKEKDLDILREREDFKQLLLAIHAETQQGKP